MKIYASGLSICLLVLCLQASLFYQNLTYVGNLDKYHIYYLIYGILQSIFYFYGYVTILRQYEVYTNKKRNICFFLMTLNIVGLFFPYDDNRNLLAQIHVYSNMSACIGSYIICILFLKDILHKNILTFHKGKNILFLILSISMVILFIFGDINSLLELVLMIGLNIFFPYISSLYSSQSCIK